MKPFSWSYSKLIVFEQCPYRYKLQSVDYVPQEKNPAADRGTDIHGKAEHFVDGSLPSLPTELCKFQDEFVSLRQHYKQGNVQLEQEWGFDKDWMPTNFKTAWLRMKADAVVHNDDRTQAIVIDYKTGKKFGNEIKHGEQVQLYSLATAIREPSVKLIKVELWYIDKDDLTPTDYTREQAIKLSKSFSARAKRVETAHEKNRFEANPNIFTCQYCPYGPNKGAQCPHGISAKTTTSISDYRKRFL